MQDIPMKHFNGRVGIAAMARKLSAKVNSICENEQKLVSFQQD
jgi:hypothetical protein